MFVHRGGSIAYIVVLVALGMLFQNPSILKGPAQGTLTIHASKITAADTAISSTNAPPQPGLTVTIADLGGTTITGTTDANGSYTLPQHTRLIGGHLHVQITVPPSLQNLQLALSALGNEHQEGNEHEFTELVDISAGRHVSLRTFVWEPAGSQEITSHSQESA